MAASGMDLGAQPPAKYRLAPTVKQTGQEPGCQLITQFRLFWPFLQSKSVNNVCKLFQLLWDLVPRPRAESSLLDPTGGLPSPDPLCYSPLK